LTLQSTPLRGLLSAVELARFGGLLFVGAMKYLSAMESDDEFTRLLDSFIEEMRNQHERSFGFRELRAYLPASIGDDTLTAIRKRQSSNTSVTTTT
jgi:hypothetical protein